MHTVASSPRADEGAPHAVAKGIDSTRGSVTCHAFAFGGSGGEYFRIWIVNLLLTTLTVGIYYPWAKVRKLRYFREQTTLAGHRFDFHGEPRRMLRGYALVAALFVLTSMASRVSQPAAALAFLGLVALWPALLRASWRFRSANTSWRGRRFAFDGGMAGAYAVWLPLLPPAFCFTLAVGLGEGERAAGRVGSEASRVAAMMIGMTMLGFLALAPLSWWLMKRYQHDHFRLGTLRTTLGTGVGRFYELSFKVVLLPLLVTIVLGATAMLVVRPLVGAGGDDKDRMAMQATAAMIAGYAMLVLFVRPYIASRLHNLVWSGTTAPGLQFVSTLRYWPLVGLTAKNWLLVLLTLGLYLPFAAVANARMRIHAMMVACRIDLDGLVADARPQPDSDATDEAAGDLLDIDLGL